MWHNYKDDRKGGTPMALTEKKRASNKAYMDKLKRIGLYLKPEYDVLIREAAKAAGMSNQAFIISAVKDYIARNSGKE